MPFDTENMPMDQDRISQRAYAIWEKAGKPDGAHEEHWEQACRETEAEAAEVMPDRVSVTALNKRVATSRSSNKVARRLSK